MRVLKNSLQSMALNPRASAVSGKDGLFLALLDEDVCAGRQDGWLALAGRKTLGSSEWLASAHRTQQSPLW